MLVQQAQLALLGTLDPQVQQDRQDQRVRLEMPVQQARQEEQEIKVLLE